MHPFDKLTALCRINSFPLLRVEYGEASNEFEVWVGTMEVENPEFMSRGWSDLDRAYQDITTQMRNTGYPYSYPC